MTDLLTPDTRSPSPGPRFPAPPPGAVTTRAQLIDAHGATFGHYRLPFAEPPIYLQDGVCVFALNSTAPDPAAPQTLAVYVETILYPLGLATKLNDGD